MNNQNFETLWNDAVTNFPPAVVPGLQCGLSMRATERSDNPRLIKNIKHAIDIAQAWPYVGPFIEAIFDLVAYGVDKLIEWLQSLFAPTAVQQETMIPVEFFTQQRTREFGAAPRAELELKNSRHSMACSSEKSYIVIAFWFAFLVRSGRFLVGRFVVAFETIGNPFVYAMIRNDGVQVIVHQPLTHISIGEIKEKYLTKKTNKKYIICKSATVSESVDLE
jgi:hypothetical protein